MRNQKDGMVESELKVKDSLFSDLCISNSSYLTYVMSFPNKGPTYLSITLEASFSHSVLQTYRMVPLLSAFSDNWCKRGWVREQKDTNICYFCHINLRIYRCLKLNSLIPEIYYDLLL